MEDQDEYSNHNLTVTKIAKEMNVPKEVIKRIILNFFSRYGLKLYISQGYKVRIYGFGKFVPNKTGKGSLLERKKKLKLLTHRRKDRKFKSSFKEKK